MKIIRNHKKSKDNYGFSLSILVINTGSEGPDFGRSINPPKSIAIDQESLISHFGISEALKNSIIILKHQESTQTQFFLPYLGLIRPRFWEMTMIQGERFQRKRLQPHSMLLLLGTP